MSIDQELHELSLEMNTKDEEIVKKWRSENPYIVRGECNTPEMRALREERKNRYFAIIEKYKNNISKI